MLLVKNARPLSLKAGNALMISVVRTNASAAAGSSAKAKPIRRAVWSPRSSARSRRGSGVPAPPSGGSACACPAMKSAADLGDQGIRLGDDTGWQRLEVDRLKEVGRALAGVHDPVQERADVLSLDRVALAGLHDGVFVVDDRVAVRGRPVDHRDGLVGGRARGERGSLG